MILSLLFCNQSYSKPSPVCFEQADFRQLCIDKTWCQSYENTFCHKKTRFVQSPFPLHYLNFDHKNLYENNSHRKDSTTQFAVSLGPNFILKDWREQRAEPGLKSAAGQRVIFII